jgi:hypothetical protein
VDPEHLHLERWSVEYGLEGVEVRTDLVLKRTAGVEYLALEHSASGIALVLTLNRCGAESLRDALTDALLAWDKRAPELAELGAKTPHPEDR